MTSEEKKLYAQVAECLGSAVDGDLVDAARHVVRTLSSSQRRRLAAHAVLDIKDIEDREVVWVGFQQAIKIHAACHN